MRLVGWHVATPLPPTPSANQKANHSPTTELQRLQVPLSREASLWHRPDQSRIVQWITIPAPWPADLPFSVDHDPGAGWITIWAALKQCTTETMAQVAKRLDLERYVERGIKGKFPVDWETKEGPRLLLAQLVADAQRL